MLLGAKNRVGVVKAGGLVGIREAAERLGVSVPTLRRWDKSGKLRATRHPLSGERVYRAESLERAAARDGQVTTPPWSPAALRGSTGEVIGRSAELQRLASFVKSGARVITVVGPGGIGKTTLSRRALEVLSSEAPAPRVAFCDLSSTPAEADRIATAIARDLGFELPAALGEVALRDLLARRLAQLGSAVVVLDNAEHILASVAETVAELRAKTSDVTFLVTSREKLHLREETVLSVGPLSLPPSSSPRTPARVLASDAVAMLVACATRAGAPLDASAHAEALLGIARRLDGIPLALELAAARLSTFSPARLLERLDAQLDLAAPHRDAPARHKTLRAAIGWSYELLSKEEQRLFERLSLFRGGFDVLAVERVADPTWSSAPASLLQSLLEKSMVRHVPGAKGPRFDLFASLRDFAAERLAERPRDAAAGRERYAHHFESIARRALEAVPTDVRLDEVVEERENFLAALELLRGRDPAAALRLVIGVDHAAGASLSIVARLAWLDDAIARAELGDVDPALLARAHATRGRLMMERGDGPGGARALTRAVALARGARAPELEEYALGLFAVERIQEGRRDEALKAIARVERLARRGPDVPARALTWAAVGSVQHELGALEASARSYTRAAALARSSGEHVLAARIEARLGRVGCDRGRLDEADEALRGALPVLHAASDRYEAWALAHRALVRFRQERLDDARRDYQGAVALFALRGAVGFEIVHRALFAAVLAALGRGVEASIEIERARVDRALLDDPQIDPALDLAAAHVSALEARRARIRGDAREERRAKAAARAALRGARAATTRDKDVRALAERLLAALDPVDWPVEPTLIVARDGAWLSPPGSPSAELPPASPLRALLGALVRARADRPGRALSRAELCAAAWPGERIMARAAAQRLYAAVSELRALGLGRHLERAADGYRIAPALPVRLEPKRGAERGDGEDPRADQR